MFLAPFSDLVFSKKLTASFMLVFQNSKERTKSFTILLKPKNVHVFQN